MKGIEFSEYSKSEVYFNISKSTKAIIKKSAQSL